MIVDTLVLGPVQTNCYIVRGEAGGEAVVIDPAAEPERIKAASSIYIPPKSTNPSTRRDCAMI